MSAAYRDNANTALAVIEPGTGQGEYINGGKLERAEGDHNCPVPGWWSRRWHDIKCGDVWHCVCGAEWEWMDADKSPYGYSNRKILYFNWCNHKRRVCKR